MEEPAPVVFQTPKDKDISLKKEYILKEKNISYKLIIYIDSLFIHFKINEFNNIPLYNYQNKYNYDSIINILHLDNKIYNNLKTIFKLIDQAYLNKNITMNLDNNTKIYLNIILFINNQHNKYLLVLNKVKLEINEKFEIIINEINNLKKENNNLLLNDNELEKLQQLINNLENKIYEKFQNNKKKLNLLQKAENDNAKIINENKNKIISLKNQIKQIENKTLFLINNNNNNNNKNNNNNNNNKINIENNNKNNENNENKIKENIEEEYRIEKIYNINPKHSLLFKIILIGNALTGKTWITESFISYPSSSFATCGLENKQMLMKINNTIVKLWITDCPGVEKYFSIAKTNCKNKHLIMFVYSIDNLESFNIIKTRIKEIKNDIYNNNISYILIGNKADLEDKRKITYEEGQELANKEKMDLFIEVSAKMNFNIDELFFQATKIIYKKNQNKK